MHLTESVSIKQMFITGFISRRIHNTCCRAGLHTVSDIVDYYNSHHSFLELHMCGNLVNGHLIRLCRKFELEKEAKELPAYETASATSRSEPQQQTSRLGDVCKERNTDPIRWELAEIEYEKLKNKLSRRARNRLLSVCNGATFYSLSENLHQNASRQLQRILDPHNVSGAELRYFLSEVNNILPGIPPSKDITTNPLNYLYQKMSLYVPCQASDEMGIFLKENFAAITTGRFPLLAFAHVFIQKCTGINENYKTIFLRITNWYASNVRKAGETIDEMKRHELQSLTYYISREKINEQLMKLLAKAIAVLQQFELRIPAAFVLKEEYQLCRYDDLIAQTPFTNTFVQYFMAMLNPSYTAVKVNTGEKIEYFLFTRCVAERFDVLLFSIAAYKLSKTKNVKERTLLFFDFLTPFVNRNTTKPEFTQIVTIAQSLLQNLYGINVYEDGYLQVQTITVTRNWEYVQDILKKENRACKLTEITAAAAQNGVQLNPATLQVLLNNNKLFVVASKGMYGLKEWEKDKDAECGTINQLIVKYLNEQEEPKHVFDITRWIMQYRSAYPYSIYRHLKRDELQALSSFGHGFYGLTNKPYNVTGFKKLNREWLYHVKRSFTVSNKHRIEMKTIVSNMCNRYGVLPVQVEYQIYEKIAAGIFTEEDGYLVFPPM